MSLRVWANITDAIGNVCHDARLRTERGETATASTSRGQAGWDMGMAFNNLDHLSRQLTDGAPLPDWMVEREREACSTPDRLTHLFPPLRPASPLIQVCAGRRTVQRGEITRFGICVHGNRGGVLSINGLRAEGVSPDNYHRFCPALDAVFSFTAPHATILFLGCLAGMGEAGTRLLRALSALWPTRTFVGFSTIGAVAVGRMRREGEWMNDLPCTEAGMRDTDNTFGGEVRDYTAVPARDTAGRRASLWDVLPWASESSPHAKVVRGGVVVRGSEL